MGDFLPARGGMKTPRARWRAERKPDGRLSGRGRARYAWVTLLPLAWLAVVTLTAGGGKGFAAGPPLGVLAPAAPRSGWGGPRAGPPRPAAQVHQQAADQRAHGHGHAVDRAAHAMLAHAEEDVARRAPLLEVELVAAGELGLGRLAEVGGPADQR